ncbi:MAG: cyclopropane fatty acyl phospholipid synthase [Desulfoprunum sp.]|jgi:cyclopropane-fatty-acyl-phospholipid synthase|uniref:cyclopropane fatty acyl phospholipid synthase n=1 Tax=Desulfoprunum sp. TaxID=2020866 RepID=UPI00052DD6B9|nr:cyclopropane fatty acyl phospholipid synthase [Desulfobulbus sp. Tol-SR]
MLARKFNEMLEPAGITINGGNPWDIQVHDRKWFGRILREKNLGLGESYMDGWWDCGRLDEMFHRLLRSGLEERIKGGLLYLSRLLPGSLVNLQSRRRSRMVAEQHYDLGNDLFFSFLDSHQQYSCGFFQDTDDLDRAQERKLQLIADKLDLSAEDHLLDIGCGWGGLARYAAQHYGCTVTAVNISQEQLQHARQRCKGLPVQFQDCDYRSLSGRFDKVVSVGMFEHVGQKNYRTFMQVVSRCLKDDGIFLLHSIVGNTSKTCCDPWINKYIFPNGVLPSMRQIARATDQLFVVEDVHNLGPHYDKTLMAWNDRFQQAWQNLKESYDIRFKRMWEYYLLSCAGAFRARNIQLWQIVMTKFGIGRRQPDRRP